MSVEEVDLKKSVEEELQKQEEDHEKPNEVIQDWSDEEAAEAEAMGWIPPDRAKKLPDGKKFVGPKEFMERNPLYNKLKKMEASFGQLTEHYHKVSENERKKAEKEYNEKLAQLKAEKVEAIKEGDGKRVVEIDDEIQSTEKPEAQDNNDPVFNEWSGKNDWYEKDRFLRVEANNVAQSLAGEGLFGVELLDAVSDHIKQKYPKKFQNQERDKPPVVEETTPPGKPEKKTVSAKDLTSDEREVFKNFERMNIFKDDNEKQKYFREVIELRD